MVKDNNPIKVAMDMARLSVERVADIIGVSRQTVNNYLKNRDQIPAEKIFILSSATGISMEKLYGYEQMQKGPNVKPVYAKKFREFNKFVDQVKDFSKDLSSIKIEDDLTLCDKERKRAVSELDDIIRFASMEARKPTICVFGVPDAGKSTLINYLLGEKIVPADYSPMTTVPIYIMHVEERPDTFENPVDNAIVFGRKKDDGKEEKKHSDLIEEIPEEYIIRKGNYKSILKEFGTRKGEYYDYYNKDWEIDEIDIFINVNLLKEVTLIDIPGFGSDNPNDNIYNTKLTMSASEFDLVFFLSPSNSYLKGPELVPLCRILRTREDSSKVYLLATHTNSIGDPEKIEEIIRDGCERIVPVMSEDEKERFSKECIKDYNSKEEKVVEVLKKRCFGFNMTSIKYCRELNERIEDELPNIINKRFERTIKYVKELCKKYQENYKILLNKIDKEKRTFKSKRDIEKQRKESEEAKNEASKHLDEAKMKLEKSIEQKKGESVGKMKYNYEKVINEQFITNIIEQKKLKNKKEDIEILSNCLCEELNDRMQGDLVSKSERFAEEIEEALKKYQDVVISGVKKLDIDFNSFDFTRAFAAGLAGVTTYGALAVWAMIVANGSNLGAYILVAKVVSALSALGISVGGTAAAAAFVSSIGGPVTIGISLAIIAAIAVFGVFTGTWKPRIAKKLIKVYKEKGVCNEYCNAIEKYWDDTRDALEECMKSLLNQVQKHYEEQNEIAKVPDEKYRKMIWILQTIYDKCVDGYGYLYQTMIDNGDVDDTVLDDVIENKLIVKES